MTPMRRNRARALTACVLAAAAAAWALAGCGGEEGAPPRPAIEARLAADLAARSEAVASALESGDVCTAAVRADELVAAVDDAVARGRIPHALRERLTTTAIGLQNEVNCPPAPAPAPTTVEEQKDEGDEDGGRGKAGGERGKGEAKKEEEKKDRGDD
jgi:hypothetical protein